MTKKQKSPKRPKDVVSNAVHVMRVLTGETDDVQPSTPPEKNAAAQELGRKGGAARAKSMSAKRRSEIARKAAKSRWKIQKE